jgi:hypothetical protein
LGRLWDGFGADQDDFIVVFSRSAIGANVGRQLWAWGSLGWGRRGRVFGSNFCGRGQAQLADFLVHEILHLLKLLDADAKHLGNLELLVIVGDQDAGLDANFGRRVLREPQDVVEEATEVAWHLVLRRARRQGSVRRCGRDG